MAIMFNPFQAGGGQAPEGLLRVAAGADVGRAAGGLHQREAVGEHSLQLRFVFASSRRQYITQVVLT